MEKNARGLYDLEITLKSGEKVNVEVREITIDSERVTWKSPSEARRKLIWIQREEIASVVRVKDVGG